jgi:outer membrane scaffolding protein for murein synthesis (MipA/OmpV family)
LPAQTKPLWEFGLGFSTLSAPDYTGSDERREWYVPFPYFVYRGQILRVDRESLRGRLFSTERFELEVSFNGTLPVDSKHNSARRGMPDLDFSGEVGPRLRWFLYRSRAVPHSLYLDLPVRPVFVSDFTYLDYLGWTSSPALHYEGRYAKWNVEAISGVEFADAAYNQYFYGVDTKYVTPTRAAYRADSGYGGIRVALGASRRIGRLFIGAFTRYINLDGATFADSPLVRTHHSVMAGVAIAWVFHESSTLVDERGRPVAPREPEATEAGTSAPMPSEPPEDQ